MDSNKSTQVSEKQLAFRRTLMEIIGNNSRINVVLVLDDSKQMDGMEYSHMVKASNCICRSLSTNNAQFGVIAFHSTSSIISSLAVYNSTTFVKMVYGHKRLHEGTNIAAGLDAAAQMLTSASSTDAIRICIVITGVDCDPKANSQAFYVNLQRIIICCIGVGPSTSLKNLQRIASLDKYAIGMQDMQQLANLFNTDMSKTLGAPTVAHSAKMSVLAAAAYVTKTPVTFQESLILRVTIHNSGTEISSGICVILHGGEYFNAATYRVPTTLHHKANYEFDVAIKPAGKPITMLPDSIQFTFTHPNGKHLPTTLSVPLRSEYFIGTLKNFTLSNPTAGRLNVLLFGIVGCGKSSFLNSIISACSSEVMHPAFVGGEMAHVTQSYRRYEVGRLVEVLSNLEVNLWDTWGLEERNYSRKFLSQLLDGIVPDGFKMENIQNDGTISPEKLELKLPHERRVHGVLLFVPVGILVEDDLIDRVHEVLKEMNERSLQPLIVVTRADTIEACHRLAHQQAIAQLFNVPEFRVRLVTNYTKSRTHKDLSIDKISLDIFTTIVKTADTYAKTYAQVYSLNTPTLKLPPSSTVTATVVTAAISNLQPEAQSTVKLSTSKPTSALAISNKSTLESTPNMSSTNISSTRSTPSISSTSTSTPSSSNESRSTSSGSKSSNENLATVMVHFKEKKFRFSVSDTDTFGSLLAQVAMQVRVKAEDYCFASNEVGGAEYPLQEIIWASVREGKPLYMREDEGFQ